MDNAGASQMLIEVRVELKPRLFETIRANENGIRRACELLRRQGVERRLVRVHGARTEKDAGRVVLVWRVAQEELWTGDLWERQPTTRLRG